MIKTLIILFVMSSLIIPQAFADTTTYTNSVDGEVDGSGDTRTITVPELYSNTITDVNVIVDYWRVEGASCTDIYDTTASYPMDTSMSIESPEGTVVNLVINLRNNDETYTNWRSMDRVVSTFDDSALNLVGSTNDGIPETGTFYSLEPLSAFNNEDSAGDWIFTYDDANHDTAILCFYQVDIEITTLDGSTSDDSPKKKSNGGGCSDCIPPTFGKDKDNKQVVQGGFSFDGNITDVSEYWTPYQIITAQTNTTHNFTLKAYENFGVNNIKWFQFGVVEKVGTPLNNAEVLVTIYIHNTEIEKIVERDPNNLFDIVNATSYIENCGYIISDCLELSIDVIFRDELKNKVIVIEAMDKSRNADTKFLNEGIEIVGESINGLLIDSVIASHGGTFYPQRAGIVELLMTSYKDNKWQDIYGYMWEYDLENKTFRITDTIPTTIKEPDVMWQAMTRINSNFADMVIYEQQRAIQIFNSSEINNHIVLNLKTK